MFPVLRHEGEGSASAIEGWLIYGAALNEGRAMFPPDDDYNFGKWKQANVYGNLPETLVPEPHEEAAAIWAAANPAEFAEAPSLACQPFHIDSQPMP